MWITPRTKNLYPHNVAQPFDIYMEHLIYLKHNEEQN